MADKISKAQAHYSKGMKQSHCGICRHFERPDGCEVVAGKIEPDMWCEYFKARRGKRAKGERWP